MEEGRSLAVGGVLCGKWQIVRQLGMGGMAVVYEASHRNGKRVAIKVLRADFRANKLARSRFLREGYIANRVNHPHVPSVLDDGETGDGDAFLVMDLLVGETLAAQQKLRAFSAAEVTRIADAVLDVLSAAHERGIVHRDIKPSNVFLTTDGVVKVLDFGIARLREARGDHDASTLTQRDSSPGTPAFMAPEQARGHWQDVGACTDIWAVGALMFVLLTGRAVHEGQTSNELLILSATSPAQPVASLRTDLPRELAVIVDRALAFHRALRWPDARAMQAALRALLHDSAAVSRLPSERSVALPSVRAEALATCDQLSAVVDVKRKTARSKSVTLVGLLLLSVGLTWLTAAARARPASAPSGVLERARRSSAPSPPVSVPVSPIPSPWVESASAPMPAPAPVHRLRRVGKPASGNQMSNPNLSPTQEPQASVSAPAVSADASRTDSWLERQK